jgi:hypothetical protein
MCSKFHRKAVIIVVSIAGVRIFLSEIVRGPRNLIKGRIPVRVIRTRARGQ